MEALEKRLAARKEEYKRMHESLMLMMGQEFGSSTYEKNAISALVVMQELNAEIRTLEFAVQLARITAGSND